MIKRFEHYDYTNLRMGDVVSPGDVEISLDTIYVYYRYENFYHVNRQFFHDFRDIKKWYKYSLEDFYKQYPELTVEAFLEINKDANSSSLHSVSRMLMANKWVKRIPDLEIYMQIDKYNI